MLLKETMHSSAVDLTTCANLCLTCVVRQASHYAGVKFQVFCHAVCLQR